MCESRYRRSVQTPQQQQEGQAIHAALAQFLSAVLRQHGAAVRSSSQLLATCCQALGDFAFWWSASAAASAGDVPLTEAVMLCLGAAVTPGAAGPRVCPEACTALRHLVAANIPAAVMVSPDLIQVCFHVPMAHGCVASYDNARSPCTAHTSFELLYLCRALTS